MISQVSPEINTALPSLETRKVCWHGRFITWMKVMWNDFCKTIGDFFERIADLFKCKSVLPKGFLNLGKHTCYINSAIQALFWNKTILNKAKGSQDPLIQAIFRFIQSPMDMEAATALRLEVNEKCGFGPEQLECQQDVCDLMSQVLERLGVGNLLPLEGTESVEKAFEQAFFEGTPEIMMVRLPNSNQDGLKRTTMMPLPANGRLSIGNLSYQIVGTIRHQGERLTSGHYFACSLRDKQWWRCDDDKVSPIVYEDLKEFKGVDTTPITSSGAFDSQHFDDLKFEAPEINVALILQRM